VSFAAVTLVVASQGLFIVVSVYSVMDSVRKLLDNTGTDIFLQFSHTIGDFRPVLPEMKTFHTL
jgi:hypothetical protein